MRGIFASSVLVLSLVAAHSASAQQLPALPDYPKQIVRCGVQLEPGVGFDCMTGSYQAAFRESSSPFAPALSIWTHSNDFAGAFLKHSGDSYENFNPAIKTHVAWADFHVRIHGFGSSEIKLNRSNQAVSLTTGTDSFPEIADLWGCCGNGMVWQVRQDLHRTGTLTWDVVFRPLTGGMGVLTQVSSDPDFHETRPVVSTVGGNPLRGHGGHVTMAWQTAKTYPGAQHSIEWAMLEIDGTIVDKDVIRSGLDAMHPAIDKTLICYDAGEHRGIDRNVYCRDISTEEGRYLDYDEPFKIKTNEKCKSYSRPRLGGEGRFVIYLAEECEDQRSDAYKQLHLTDLHTGGVYIVVEKFGNGTGDCIRHPGSCHSPSTDYYSDNTDKEKYRYDINRDMIVYSLYSPESTERCVAEHGYSAPDYDLHYYWIDVAAL